jgi:hypothetical protein
MVGGGGGRGRVSVACWAESPKNHSSSQENYLLTNHLYKSPPNRHFFKGTMAELFF